MGTNIVQICEQAIRRLEEGPLTNREQHNELYVPRDEPPMRRLLRRLELGALADKAKLVFSGHIGSGKSSELFHLKRSLEESQRATAIYWSVHRQANLVGLNTVRFLTAVARVLRDWLTERQRAPKRFDERLREALGTTRQTKKVSRGAKMQADLGLEIGPMQAGGQLHSGYEDQDEQVYVPDLGTEGILRLVNQLFGEVRSLRPDAPVLLICDDLEKLDLSTAEAVFSQGFALASVDACVLFTVPIGLLYSERCSELLGSFDRARTVLPVFKVRDRAGHPSGLSLQRLRALILRRVPYLDHILTPAAFDDLSLTSGGVLSNLIEMMRVVCFEALDAPERTPFDSAIVPRASKDLRADFFRQVPGELYDRLRRVRNDPDSLGGGGMDGELARLLALGVVLEYANDEFWYRMHPLAATLIRADDPR